ncbi:response regulator [bacterium SCSIO 12741]|nr:response regulator [bacterium SCSIO 12741]
MSPEFSNIHVLLVENDEIAIFVMEKILKPHYRLTVARNGIEAIHLAHKQNFDVILMDIELGHSMDGSEVLEAMKQNGMPDETLVYAITGLGIPEDEEYFLSLGFDRFFHKPIDHRQMAEIIRQDCYVKTL